MGPLRTLYARLELPARGKTDHREYLCRRGEIASNRPKLGLTQKLGLFLFVTYYYTRSLLGPFALAFRASGLLLHHR